MKTIADRVKDRLVSSLKSGDREACRLYRFLKGRFDNDEQSPLSDAKAVQIIRAFIKDASKGDTSISPREVQLMSDLVPPVLDHVETRKFLDENGTSERIRVAPKEGVAIGMAMKALSQGHRLVDGTIVSNVVKSIREGNQ